MLLGGGIEFGSGTNAWDLFRQANSRLLDGEGLTGSAFDRLVSEGRPVETSNPKDLPMMVRFGDLNDPRSVKRVNPGLLDYAFGAGVSFVKATVEITSDPVSVGIEKWLPWLAMIGNNQLSGTYLKPVQKFSDTTNSANFSWSMK